MKNKKLRLSSNDKSVAQFIHSKNRLYERFGIELTKELHKSLVEQIQTGKATFVEKQSNRVSVFSFVIGTDTVFVVYDKHRKNIVTFLFPEMELFKY